MCEDHAMQAHSRENKGRTCFRDNGQENLIASKTRFVSLTVHEAVPQHPQDGVVVHDGLPEHRAPEQFDVLRPLPLQPVQNVVESFPQSVFALHATHVLHRHTDKYREDQSSTLPHA